MDAVAAAGGDRAVHHRGDRLHDRVGQAASRSRPHRGPGVDLVARGVHRRADRRDRQGDPVLPVHERLGRADGAARARLLRDDPLVLHRPRALEVDRLGRRRSDALGGGRLGEARPSLRRRAGLDLHLAAADRRPGGAARVRRRHPAADDRRLAGRDPRRGLDRLDRRRRPPAAMGLRLEPVGQPERADVAGRRARGRERGRRSADRPADERRRAPGGDLLRSRRPRHGHEHRLRVDEDLLQRVPHRSVGRSDRACRDLPGHGAELPGGAADDVVHRQRRLRRRRAVALLRGVPRPEQPVRQPGAARGLRAALRGVPRAAGRVRDQGLLRRPVQRAGVPGRRSGDAGQRAAGREGRAVPAGDGRREGRRGRSRRLRADRRQSLGAASRGRRPGAVGRRGQGHGDGRSSRRAGQLAAQPVGDRPACVPADRAGLARVGLVRRPHDDGPDGPDPGHVGRHVDAVGDRCACDLARLADDGEGLGGGRRRDRPRRRAALRRLVVAQTPRELRRVLQQALLAVLDEGLRRAARRAVPRPGRSGCGAGRDRQVDRFRRSEGLRHLERALGRLPAEGRPVAVHPVHPDLAVHRRVHRPVPASAGDVVGEPDRCRDRRGDRESSCSSRSAPIPRRARRPPRSA